MKSVVGQVITDVAAALVTPVGITGGPPTAPPEAPLAWTVPTLTRRDLEHAVEVPDAATTAPTNAPAVNQDAGAEGTHEAPARIAVPSEPSAADQDLYTGHPSLITQVVELGLRIVDVVLKPFGGLLAFTSLDVPFFTDGTPPFFVTGGLDVQQSKFDGMNVWTLRPQDPTGQYVVALHGGAFTAQVSLFHWDTYAAAARDTGATVVVPLYPLISQGGTAGVVVPETADFIAQMVQAHGAENVSVLGDSAGGGLAVAAMQQLVRRGTPTPSRMVLLAPWLDLTVGDPRSAAIDPNDPLLDVPNLQKDGVEWAGDLDPTNPLVSPIYGSLAGLPPTTVFSGSLDLLTPDSLRLRQLAITQGLTNFAFDFRNGLIHDWPIFGFLPEATAARPEIYRALLGTRP